MSSLSIPFSFAIFNSMQKISITRRAAVHRHAKINDHSARIPAHCTPHVVSHLSDKIHCSVPVMVDSTAKDVRPLTTSFTPSIWGDIFSTFCFDNQVQQKYSEEIEALKKDARGMLMAATSTKLMILIDKLERLGIAYHFETEIDDKLKQVYDSAEEEEEDCDLFTTALRFRLLRQHQYQVSCNAFVKFVDKDNKLKEGLSSDVEGLLSLYEAAHVRINDENVLEEALAFTTRHLTRMLPQLESPIKEQVQQALKYPNHKSLMILALRFHIDIYENDDSRDELVLRLAKLNFNYMQNIYRNEIFQLTKWWNKFDLTSKLPYFRDRLVESYMVALSYNFVPKYSLVRVMIAKYYMMITVVDDTYDNYATLEEIELFTHALERWNVDEIDVLPDYLKVVYKLIMSFVEEFEGEAEKHGKSYVVPYYIEAFKELVRGFGEEQKWSTQERQIPSFEEYMRNAQITSQMHLTFIATVAFIESATKETIDWVLSDSQFFMALVHIGRLLDDISSHQRESKDGAALTGIDYYMKDKGVSIEEAQCAIKKIIEDSWKDMSAGWVNCSMVPKEMTLQILNLARMCETLYMDGEDGFTSPDKNLAPLIATFLLDPLPV